MSKPKPQSDIAAERLQAALRVFAEASVGYLRRGEELSAADRLSANTLQGVVERFEKLAEFRASAIEKHERTQRRDRIYFALSKGRPRAQAERPALPSMQKLRSYSEAVASPCSAQPVVPPLRLLTFL